MSDIFVSYSSQDREKAEQLTALLASAGLSVWIDQSGIDAATSWSEEIVEAIDACKAFIVMLSPNSIASHNVVKEVSLASEKRKKILPLDLEPVELPKSLQYALAGIQRAPMTNIDSIIRALGKIGLEATGAPLAPQVTKQNDGRKSLIILPFEDLSPTADNQWFADGLAGELIDALAHVKSLRILDRKTSLGLRGVRQSTLELGKLFNTRYFIEGNVRKFGDQIKISVSLLDIETGDYLWQESHRGEFNNIFDIQEAVASKVVEALRLHLTDKERYSLDERKTQNPQAYELFVKANEYFDRQTKEGFVLASQLLTSAIELDPSYAFALQRKAYCLVLLYSKYDPDPALLVEAESLAHKALEINPNLLNTYHPLAMIRYYRGDVAGAESTLKEYVQKEPDDQYSHYALGSFYWEIGDLEKSVVEIAESARLDPDNIVSLVNLSTAYNTLGDTENCKRVSLTVLPMIERHLKLHPTDEARQVTRANLLFRSGQAAEALKTAEILKTTLRDASSLYNLANLFENAKDFKQALLTTAKAIDAGYANREMIKSFVEGENFIPFHTTPEYAAILDRYNELKLRTTASHG